MNIRAKIIIAFLAVSISGITFIGYFTFYFSEKQFIAIQAEKLIALAERQKRSIVDALEAWDSSINLITSRTQLKIALKAQQEAPDPKHVAKMREILRDALHSVREIHQINICTTNGKPLISVTKEDRGSPVCDIPEEDKLKNGKLQSLWIDPADGTLHYLLLGTLRLDGELIGYIDVIASAKKIVSIVNDYSGLGNTGETILARRVDNGQAEFFTPLRYQKQKEEKLKVSFKNQNLPIIQALNKQEIFLAGENTVDYRGAPIVAATAYIPQMDWGLVVKIDRKDVLTPVRLLLRTITVLIIFVCSVVVVAGLFFGNAISNPIKKLARIAEKFRKGDFTQRANITTRDEIGYLAGTFDAMLASISDKTSALEESEKRMRSIFNSAMDGIVTIDAKGTIQFTNPATQKLFGYTAKELTGQNVKILMPEPYHSRHDEYLMNYARTGGSSKVGVGREVLGKRRDGSVIPLELGIGEIFLKGEKIIVGTLRDISERKKSEEEREDLISQLSDSNEELEEFAYRTSHDLRSPLVSSISLLKMTRGIVEDHGEPEVIVKRVDQVLTSLERLENLVKDILTLTQTKNIEEEAIELDVAELVNETLEKFSHMSNFDRLTFYRNFDFPGLPKLKKSRFSLIVENLISNAVKYQDVEREESFVEIATYKQDECFVLEVRDNGIGIPQEQQGKLFCMFKRFHSRVSFGSGLGLYMMKKSSEVLGGDIAFEDPGEGTVFRLTVPLD